MEEVMQVELIAYSQWNGSDKEMEAIVEQAASVCYDSSPTEEKKLSKQCAKSGHTSVFEHISYTFHIKGVSRALLAQLSRHRHISLSVRSQRYCREDDFDYVNPYPTSDPKMYDIYASVNRANEDYQNLIAEGAAPEDARMVLPNACCTELYLTMNARTMIEIGYLRLCSRAQKEIRTLFMKIKECIKDCSPMVYAMMVPQCERFEKYPFCPEGKSCGRHPKLKDVYNEDAWIKPFE